MNDDSCDFRSQSKNTIKEGPKQKGKKRSTFNWVRP